MATTSIQSQDYHIISLSKLWKQDFYETKRAMSNFKCQEHEVEHFLHTLPEKFETNGLCRTYIFFKGSLPKISILGYFSLSVTAITLNRGVSRLISPKLSNYYIGGYGKSRTKKAIPAYYIAQLGRDSSVPKSELPGDRFLKAIFSLIKQAQSIVGNQLVIVECKSVLLKKYYAKKANFALLGASSLRSSSNKKTVLAYTILK